MPLIARRCHGPEVLAAGERRCAVLRLDAIHRLTSLLIHPEHRRWPSIGADDLISDRESADGREPARRKHLAEDRLRTPTHEGQWRDLDLAALHRAREALRRHELVKRVVQRTEVWVDLLREIARKEAEPLPRLHGRPREDETRDLAIAKCGNTERYC